MIIIIKDIDELKQKITNENLISDLNLKCEPFSINNGYKIFYIHLSKDDDHVSLKGIYSILFTVLNPKIKENLKTVCIPVFESQDDYNAMTENISCYIFDGYMNIIFNNIDQDIDNIGIIVVQDAFYASRNNALQKLMTLTEV